MRRTNLLVWVQLLNLSSAAWAVDGVRLVAPGQQAAILNLRSAMDRAEQQSPERKASQAAEDAAAARESQSKRSMGPRIDLDANEAWVDKKVNKLAGQILPNGTRIPDAISNATVGLSQPLTGIWTLANKRAAEEHLREAANAEVRSHVQDVRSRAAEAYIRVLKAARRLSIAKESQDLIDRQQSDAAAQQRQGHLAALDYQRFELAAAEASAASSDASSVLEASLIALQEITGYRPQGEWVIEDLVEAPSALPQESLRPEIEGAEARVAAATKLRDVANIDYWPNLNAFIRFQRDFAAEDIYIPLPGLERTYPKEDYRDNLTYGFALNWRLWDNFTRQAHDRELLAGIKKAESEKEALATNFRIEKAQSMAEWKRVQDRVKSSRLAEQLAEKIFKAFESKFKNGLATTTDVLAAERDRARSQANLADAGYDLQLAAIRLKRAFGEKP